MSAHALSGRTRWIVSGAGAAVVLGLVMPLFTLSRIPALPTAAAGLPLAVKLVDPGPANPLVRELTVMRDLTPLFLPTDRNATLGRVPRRAPGRTLLDIETTKLSLAEAELGFDRDLPAAATLNGKPVTAARPADALPEAATGAAVRGLGRMTLPIEPLPARGGYVEVVAVGSGERVLAETLDPAVRPPTEQPWGPVQFLASVNPAGLAAPLILAERSGAEEVDQHFRNFLAEIYRVGHRLPPGIYRITIGP